jgi:hypothetical protein
MDLTWTTIEELARTSDDQAVRRRYDRRNRVVLIVLLIAFTFVSLIEAAADTDRKSTWKVLVGLVNLGFVALMYLAVWAPSLKAWTQRRMTAVTITFVALQYALVLAYNQSDPDWVAWAMTLPWVMLAFRMAATELVLLHSLLATGGALMAFIGSVPDGEKVAIAATVVNAVTLGIGLFLSRRLRKEVVGDLTERRRNAREQIRMRDELFYARELQLSMLPECAPRLPWADICSISVPATEVGGDYYDYFVEGERVALVCGDVAGHGMAAGLVLSALRTGFTLLRDSLHDPAVVLRRLHDLVAHTSRRRMLVTVSVVLIDRLTRQATLASAGHPPVILRRANGSVEAINLYAPPLGVRLPVNIPQRTIDIAPGDTFVLHSDGVYETRSAAGEDYGMERLEEVVRAHGTGTTEELRNAILSDLAAFRGTPEAADDVTLVVCRFM